MVGVIVAEVVHRFKLKTFLKSKVPIKILLNINCCVRQFTEANIVWLDDFPGDNCIHYLVPASVLVGGWRKIPFTEH